MNHILYLGHSQPCGLTIWSTNTCASLFYESNSGTYVILRKKEIFLSNTKNFRSNGTYFWHDLICFIVIYIVKYRGSPDSTSFGFRENRVIGGIVLIGDWFSTKAHEIGKFDFQSHLFYINNHFFLWKPLLFCSKKYLMHFNTIGSFFFHH